MSKHLGLAFVFSTVVVVIAYVLWDKPSGFSMYGHTYLKWVFFFLAMLLGAIVGKKGVVISGKKSVFFLFFSVLLYYAIVITSLHNDSYNDIQILSLIPLLGITLLCYTLCNCNTAQKLFKNRYINRVVMFVGGLCLEIYLIQTPLLKLDLGVPFPVSYVAMFALIIVSAYILRCGARIFSQTFNKQDYNWAYIFKAI